ncbi:MAG: AraC family transcriptional regulator [Clostridia bacterium]|nr:AraC family transcriptional regulator [Clostridia bacterium]
MFYDNELQFLQKTLYKCRLNSNLINPEDSIENQLSKSIRNLFDTDSINNAFKKIRSEIMPRTLYRLTDIFSCKYIFLELPFCDTNSLLLIGPYMSIDLLRKQILEVCERLGVSPKLSKELEDYYASIPVIKDETYIFALISTFAEFIWGGSDYNFVEINHRDTTALIPTLFKKEDTSRYDINDISVMEERYGFENKLLAAISQGNTQKAEQMLSNIPSIAFEGRNSDPVRSIKNYCIITNTLFRKAAEKGGVHPIYLDEVSSNFARKIEEISSVPTAKNFMIEILRVYCRLVRKHSFKNYSPIVKKALLLIENDLTADLSLKAIAKKNNVSSGYFSVIFKNETGQTLTEFVNKKRVELAKELLKSTGLQIQTIAQHCGILDLHYFCRIFKNATGKTPSEYRNSFYLE